MSMHIISLLGDDGDDSLFEMQLRDAHRNDVRRSGACEDDFETTTSVEGDSREDEDVFLSRPLRLETHPITRERDQDIDAALMFAFRCDLDSAIFEHEVKQGRAPRVNNYPIGEPHASVGT